LCQHSQRAYCARFAANGQGVDDADLGQAVRFIKCVQQGGVGFGQVHRFQNVSGRMRELIVGEQSGKSRYGFRRADQL
jgi:hypothetical protein